MSKGSERGRKGFHCFPNNNNNQVETLAYVVLRRRKEGNMTKTIVSVLGVSTLLTMNVSGVQFDLRDSSVEALDGSDSFSLSAGAITATLSAVVVGGTGVFNRTSTGFGINASGSGDDTDGIDGDNGVESVSITFDFDILLNSISASGFSSSDEGRLVIAGFGPRTIDSSGTFSFITDNIVTAGQSVVLSFSLGNGFSFD